MSALVAASSVALAASEALRGGGELLLRRAAGCAVALPRCHPASLQQRRCCAGPRALCTAASSSSSSSSSPPPSSASAPSPGSQQLPRFFTGAPLANVGAGQTIQLDAEEGKHARRVLRLKPGAAIELCDGEGRFARAQLLDGTREVAVVTTSPAVEVPWTGPRWVVAAACGSLKGGRADWLVEKCSELGAEALLPVLTERSPTVGRGDVGDDAGGSGRQGRWDRLAQASSKQCLRTHKLRVLAPAPVARLEEAVRAAQGLALLATQGGAPLHEVLNGDSGASRRAAGGILIIGPEGDFTPEEKGVIVAAGATGVGLGSLRLRVETAAVALLSAVSLWQPPR